MTEAIDIETTDSSEEPAEIMREIIGEQLTRTELAAVLARATQEPGFLPGVVREAFLSIAREAPESSAEPTEAERARLIELLRDGRWLDEVAQRADEFHNGYAVARDDAVAEASGPLLDTLAPLYEKLAK